LQQGVEPQQILQGLVEQGIPEEQAIQLIQQIMQQMQGQQQAQMQDGEGNPYLQQPQPQPQQQGGGQQEQIVQMVAQALQQGVEPQQILQGLVEQGIPEEQAIQLIQQIMQQMQGQQQAQQPQPVQGMRDGGKLCTFKKK
jgi:transcriptional regulator CtsR